jgi:hypothetical protein
VKRSLIQLVVTVVALFGGVWALWFVSARYEDWRYIRPWQRVSRGDSEETVVALLGRPHRIVFEQTNNASWESEHNIDWYNAESVKRYRYIPLSMTGEEYDVAFDSSGRAVSKVHITSP